ncbi:MAG: 3-methyladenine DNA glycosylase Tag [Candidatus Azotimanducaceae bacterium]|jgi:3-methyladenine DNA glycosylase Tag|tara:strand:- start:58 stop:726 length:669 start_codon:yes stop_codon:yes gene_type:complete
MDAFDKIYQRAARSKGGESALEALLGNPQKKVNLAKLNDSDVLAEMTACVFRAGFVWKIITAKWPGFEKAFNEFDVTHCAMLADEELEVLQQNTDIVRHGTKIRSVRENAQFMLDIRHEHGSFGKFLASWPEDDFVQMWLLLKKRGARLGGQSGRYFLRFIGFETPLLSRDVVAALVGAGVVEKEPTSQKALLLTQDAFNEWREQSGKGFTEISRVLAMSVG